MDTVVDFICNWTTYFYCIPIWMIIVALIIRLLEGKFCVGDIPSCIYLGLINPILNFATPIIICLAPILFIVIWFEEKDIWGKIKNKKLF